MTQPKQLCFHSICLFVFLIMATFGANASEYDPLKLAKRPEAKPIDFTIKDDARSREIPIRVFLPEEKKPAPVVLFSHGLGGSRENNPFMGEHWSGRGYVVVFVQHPGSDDSVWKSKPAAQRMAALRQAASVQNALLRFKDIPVVLDQLEKWNKAEGHTLKERMDLKRVAMSGHSFGALTTQAVSGQHATGASLRDSRISAAIMFSPSSPQRIEAKEAFGKVNIPWLLMTGTKDVAAIGNATVESRYAVYKALPPGDKYELVLHDAEHSAFTDRSLPGESGKRNPNHHRAILALTTAFLDTYLREDAKAKDWLKGDAAVKVLEEKDRWQKK